MCEDRELINRAVDRIDPQELRQLQPLDIGERWREAYIDAALHDRWIETGCCGRWQDVYTIEVADIDEEGNTVRVWCVERCPHVMGRCYLNCPELHEVIEDEDQ